MVTEEKNAKIAKRHSNTDLPSQQRTLLCRLHESIQCVVGIEGKLT